VQLVYEACRFYCRLWENRDSYVGPVRVITYIYWCGRSFASWLFFFKRSFDNQACSESKYKRGILSYTVNSIYQPRNVRFLVFIVRHLCSQIKLHINNVIFAFIVSANCRFCAFIACKSQSRHSISHVDFLTWFI
jgi:hypothetical protein